MFTARKAKHRPGSACSGPTPTIPCPNRTHDPGHTSCCTSIRETRSSGASVWSRQSNDRCGLARESRSSTGANSGPLAGRVLEGEHAGWRIDQLTSREVPSGGFFGLTRRPRRMLTTTSPVAAAWVSPGSGPESLPTMLAETPDPAHTGPAWGEATRRQLGFRPPMQSGREGGAGTPAILEDEPSHPREAGGAQVELETTALVLDGPMAKTYLGSVGWGYGADPGKRAILMPDKIELRSEGVPSPAFMAAAQAWNRLGKIEDPQTKRSHQLVRLPIQYPGFEDVKEPGELIRAIERFVAELPKDQSAITKRGAGSGDEPLQNGRGRGSCHGCSAKRDRPKSCGISDRDCRTAEVFRHGPPDGWPGRSP